MISETKIQELKKEYKREFWRNEKILCRVYKEQNEGMYQFHLGQKCLLHRIYKDLEELLK